MSEKLNQDLRQLYEATENNMKLESQKALKSGLNKSKLTKRLKIISDKSIEMLDDIVEDKNVREHLKKDMDKYNRKIVISTVNGFMGALVAVRKLSKTKPLADAIYEQTQKGIDADLKIRIKGRTWSYKAYMEMNARTTVQHNIGEEQLKVGKLAKIVFYICNVFADSADDHAKWQGKMYYDERWESFVEDKETQKKIRGLIRKKRMKSVQWVKDKPIYLTTRPNCRHRLSPISINQAGLSTEKVLNDLNLKAKTYKTDNYKATQQQRYNERMIRKYKARAESNKKLGYDTGNDTALVKRWQAKQRALVKSNSGLERDYRRESNFVIVQDLGAKLR